MPKEKRMIENYEVKTAIHIGGKEIIFAEDTKAAEPFLACNCTWDNPFGVDEYTNAVVSDDYMEIMNEFLGRVSGELQHIAEQRAERGISNQPLTTDDCIKDSRYSDFKDQLVVIRPENMTASARTADNQLVLATGGNGCNPDARGTAVFTKNLFTGKETRWNRLDVAGIIRPDRMPEWAKEKLAALGKDTAEKPSIRAQLAEGKKAIAQQAAAPKATRDKGPEL